MRRLLAVLMLLPLLLTGCAAENKTAQEALDFRTRLLEAGGCAFDADLTLNYGDTASQFSLHCEASLQDGTDLTVTAPETISGLTAHVDPAGAKLTYDGMELGFPDLASGKIAPMRAPWLLTDAWAGAYIAWTGTEGDLLRTTYRSGYGEDEIQIDVWFDGNVPVRSEFSVGGSVAMTAVIDHFSLLN